MTNRFLSQHISSQHWVRYLERDTIPTKKGQDFLDFPQLLLMIEMLLAPWSRKNSGIGELLKSRSRQKLRSGCAIPIHLAHISSSMSLTVNSPTAPKTALNELQGIAWSQKLFISSSLFNISYFLSIGVFCITCYNFSSVRLLQRHRQHSAHSTCH